MAKEPSMYEDAANSLCVLTNRELENVASLATMQVKLEDRIAKGEIFLKELKEQHKLLSEQTLPTSLINTGLSSVNLVDGTRVDVSDYYDCNISEERKENAYSWLKENAFGALIKTEVTVSFPRDSEEEVKACYELLKEHGYGVAVSEKIHPQTLKKFVKDQYTAPVEDKPIRPPAELFGIFIGKRSKVTVADKK